MHIATVLAECRKVSAGWAISLHFSTNRHRNCSPCPCRGSVGIFQKKHLLVKGALTIKCLIMSGCGQDQRTVEWLKEPLTLVSSANFQHSWKYGSKKISTALKNTSENETHGEICVVKV